MKFRCAQLIGTLSRLIICLALLITYAEYFIYYVVIYKCSWPVTLFHGTSKTLSKIDETMEKIDTLEYETIKTMFIADTHLLGPYRGHWFDKLRREWYMYRSFQTAIQLFQPEVIFFLGDLFDEGDYVDSSYFKDYYVQRFGSLFYIPSESNMKVYIIPGNHDIGFHYKATKTRVERFQSAFNSTLVQRIDIKGNTFILINSIAMEGDDCSLCRGARIKINQISEELKCEQNPRSPKCKRMMGQIQKKKPINGAFSRPILLQHFPMFRKSEELCTCYEENCDDMIPERERFIPNRNKLDCISKESTDLLLSSLNPRLVVSGHTHYSCLVHHKNPKTDGQGHAHATGNLIPEYSIPSFSPRNLKNPSFFLAHISPANYEMKKCKLPLESTMILIYIYGSLLSFLFAVKIVSLTFVIRISKLCSNFILRLIRRNQQFSEIDNENANKLL